MPLTSMRDFVSRCTTLIHLDLSGCKIGDGLLEVADDFAHAHSL